METNISWGNSSWVICTTRNDIIFDKSRLKTYILQSNTFGDIYVHYFNHLRRTPTR
jgi:hypothetical protein